MRLEDIVYDLRKLKGIQEIPSFIELERMAVQKPDLEFVNWVICNACGIENRSCASPFAPEECLQMYDGVEPVWKEIDWVALKKRGIQPGDARHG